MKKVLLYVYLWSCYIVSAPLFLVGSIGILIYGLISNMRDFGEFDFKDSVCAFYDGLREGHKINVANIEYICEN